MAKISLNVLPYETYTPPLPGIVATALLIITNSFKLSSLNIDCYSISSTCKVLKP